MTCHNCAFDLSYNEVAKQAKGLSLKETHQILNQCAWKINQFRISSNLNSDNDGELVWTGTFSLAGCPLIFNFEEDKYTDLLKKFAVLARYAEMGE